MKRMREMHSRSVGLQFTKQEVRELLFILLVVRRGERSGAIHWSG